MLVKRYIQQIDIGDDGKPFIVKNSQSTDWYHADSDSPTEQEVVAPGLVIRPHTSSEEQLQRFWSGFSSGYIGQDLPEEIMDALRGKESPWKITHCIPGVPSGDSAGSTLFTLVNPTTFTGDFGVEDIGRSVEQDVKNGVIWAYLDYSGIYSGDFDIIVKRQDANDEHYAVIRHPSYFAFIEYDADGNIRRRSEVYGVDEQGFSKICVTEFN